MARWRIVLRTIDELPPARQAFEIEAAFLDTAVHRALSLAPHDRHWRALAKDNRTSPISGVDIEWRGPRAPLSGMDLQV